MPVRGLRAIIRPADDVGAAVVLVVGRQRQQLREVDLAMDHLLRRRGAHLAPGKRIERGLLEPRQHLARLDAHRLGHPAAVGDEPGDHRDRMPAGTRKQGGAPAVEALGDGRQLETKPDLGPDHRQPVARRQMVEPVPQAADRLRRVVAMGRSRRRFAAGSSCWAIAVLGRSSKVYHRGGARPTRACAAAVSLAALARPPIWATMTRFRSHHERPAYGPMLDLGTSFLASVARDPEALAIVDGDVRLNYREWYRRISALVDGFDELGLKPGDHLVTVLQNRWQAATIHWACQFAGIIITPLNWRATADELDFCLDDAEAKAVVYEDGLRADAVQASQRGAKDRRASPSGSRTRRTLPFDTLIAGRRRGRAAAGRRRGLVGHALYVGHHRAAEGRAAPPARRARRRARPRGAKPLCATASARSASCRSITPWACARCSPCR